MVDGIDNVQGILSGWQHQVEQVNIMSTTTGGMKREDGVSAVGIAVKVNS